MLIDGIHVPLAIPFTRDGEVDWRKLEANVRRYSLAPVSGLVALAPGFEAGTLSDDECVEAWRVVRKAAADEKVLIAGIAREGVRQALALCEAAAQAEFDALLVAAPSLSESEKAMFCRSVVDAAPLPVMLWGDGLSTELIRELAQHRNVIGTYSPGVGTERLRELQAVTAETQQEVVVTHMFAPATRRMQAAAAAEDGLVSAASLGAGSAVIVAPARPTIRLRKKMVGFQLMGAGVATDLLLALEHGAAGAMPTLAACCPQAVFEVYAAFKDGDTPLAAEKSLRIVRADQTMLDLGMAGVKYGCDVNGFAGGAPRLPRLPLTAAQRMLVEDALRDIPS